MVVEKSCELPQLSRLRAVLTTKFWAICEACECIPLEWWQARSGDDCADSVIRTLLGSFGECLVPLLVCPETEEWVLDVALDLLRRQHIHMAIRLHGGTHPRLNRRHLSSDEVEDMVDELDNRTRRLLPSDTTNPRRNAKWIYHVWDNLRLEHFGKARRKRRKQNSPINVDLEILSSIPAKGPGPENEIEVPDLSAYLLDRLQSINPIFVDVINLKVDGATIRDIALELNKSPATAHNLVMDVHRLLREFLRSEGLDELMVEIRK